MTNEDVSLPMYQHEKRPAWGLAILAWERGDKRGYLFEDGSLRVIGQPYYHFMKLSQADVGTLSSAFRQQLAQLKRAKAGAHDRKSQTLFTIEEQAQFLVGQFAGGFAGEEWQRRHRADPGKKQQLKRHRDAALAAAQAVLDPKKVARAISDHAHVELWTEICELLRSTDLLTPRDLAALEKKIPAADRSLTIALAGVLHADAGKEAANDFGDRFTVLVRELTALLRKPPSWPLATSLLALYAPKRWLAVHPTSLRQQSKWMNETPIRANPNAADYERANTTARNLFQHLEQLGLAPTDLFDVYDFVRTTTTSAAKKHLEAQRQSKPVATPGAAEGASGQEAA